MNSFLYFMLKCTVSLFGLVFQILLVEIHGANFAGEVNRLQMWAFFLSMFLFPGLEFTFLRRLPKLRQQNIDDYHIFSRSLSIAQVALAVVFLLILLLSVSFFGESFEAAIVVATLTYLFLLCRLLPVFYRIDSRFLYSVLCEQGMLFFLGVIILLAMPAGDAKQLWWGVCFLSLCFIIISLAPRSFPPYSFRVKGALSIGREIREDYGLSVCLVTVANFSILWLPATLGTFLLSSDDLAISISMLRIIGLLLFIESVMSAYFLPRISAAITASDRKSETNRYRIAMSLGTLVLSALIFSTLFMVQPFGLNRSDFLGFAVFALVQLGVCYWGSPFSLAIISSSNSKIRNMSLIVIAMAILNAAVFYYFPYWQMIVFGFAALQFARAAVGANAITNDSLS